MENNHKAMDLAILVGGLHPAVPGGMEKQAAFLSRHLSERHNVVLITRYHKKNKIKNIDYELVQKKIPAVFIIRYAYDLLICVFEIFNRRNKLDFIFCFGLSNDSVKALISKLLFNIPFILSVRGPSEYRNPSLVRRIVLGIMVYHCTAIHVQTAHIKSDFISYFPNNKTEIIPNGINLSKGLKKKSSNRLNQILFVGRMVKGKGARYLIKSLDQIDSETNCVLIGDGPQRVFLEKLSTSERIKFMGYVKPDSVSNQISCSKVVNLPSVEELSEGFPNVILESMDLGTPVVASSTGGIPDVLKHGVTGFLAEPENSDDIANYNNRLLNDPELWEKISKKCIIEARKYDFPSVTKKFEEFFSRVINDR